MVLVDDQEGARRGIRMLREREPAIAVVGEPGDGAAALPLARARRPNVVLMDATMPGVHGVASAARRDPAPRTRGVVLGLDGDHATQDRSGAAGAVRVSKQRMDGALLAAIRGHPPPVTVSSPTGNGMHTVGSYAWNIEASAIGLQPSTTTGRATFMFGRSKNGKRANVTSDAIIRAEGIVKTYDTGTDKVQALRGVDVAVRRGEMVAVMGPSGCGKTTLLNSLSGLDSIDGGQIWLEGEDLARMSDRKRTDYRARRMGFIFQVYNLLPVLSAVENVELPLLVSGVKPKDARSKSMAALHTVGLAKWAKHRPAELSGGQRQRVTVARSLVNDPAIVWADEPTGALDSKTANEIMDLMRNLNRRAGLTFVLVTHDPGIGARCDRIVRMQDGVIVGQEIPRAEPEVVRVPAPAPALAMTGAD